MIVFAGREGLAEKYEGIGEDDDPEFPKGLLCPSVGANWVQAAEKGCRRVLTGER